jgi:hypothetical protein
MYDVMPDGEHFVMLLSPRYPPPTHYNVVSIGLKNSNERRTARLNYVVAGF